MLLAKKYMNDNNLNEISMAFPCISTGVYHYPKREAATIAINTIKEFDNENINVIFVCFLDEDYLLYLNLLK